MLQFLGARSFKIAAVLLGGLLAYDVFWVFGSPSVVGENVMYTVATSGALDGPLKLLFPKGTGGPFPYSLLGLGDVAIPGRGLPLCITILYLLLASSSHLQLDGEMQLCAMQPGLVVYGIIRSTCGQRGSLLRLWSI